jgi:hypothetical protein
MKTTNKVIVAILLICGMQIIAMDRLTGSRAARAGLARGCRAIGRGFTAVMGSGINFDELNRKISERHEKTGYSKVAAE